MESNHNPRFRRPVYYPLYYADMFGGKGEIRTHTGQRMKLLHNHYATLPLLIILNESEKVCS
jgi:hypothetical protein